MKEKGPNSDVPTIAARDGYAYTAPVGRFRPNAWGLFDMHGNVWEWCSDRYDAAYYKRSPVDNPPGADASSDQVILGAGAGARRVILTFRGGCWSSVQNARSACRNRNVPFYRKYNLGFHSGPSSSPAAELEAERVENEEGPRDDSGSADASRVLDHHAVPILRWRPLVEPANLLRTNGQHLDPCVSIPAADGFS